MSEKVDKNELLNIVIQVNMGLKLSTHYPSWWLLKRLTVQALSW